MTDKRDININVPVLARVEGEGALEISARNGKIEILKLRIFEPPRMFEKFLENRSYTEVLDIVARICGICPVAYQMTATQALEGIFNAAPTPWILSMRRVLYCGEWIQSHALHIHMLAAPDFLGCTSIIELAKKYPAEVRRGLKIQEAGNAIMRLLGGRSVHPVGVKIGGFWKAPDIEEVTELREYLQGCLSDAHDLVVWAASLPLPEDEQEFTSVALHHHSEYAIAEGRIISSAGLDIGIDEYQQHFIEHQVPHSTALHASLNGKPYLVGPLARLNLNQDQLPQSVRDLIGKTGISFPSKNMFHSIIARAIEILYALEESVSILTEYEIPDSPSVEVKPVAGTGYGCTEAPRGILWHRYDVDDGGLIQKANIIPPTSQNQARIEEDLRASLESFGLEKDDDSIRLHGETVIRNYDPCISCATHFLDIKIKRS